MIAKLIHSNINTVAILVVGFVLTLAISFSVLPATAHAEISNESKEAACQGIGGCDPNAKKSVTSLLSTVIKLISWIVGILSVIMVIVGGMKFVLSNGDANATKSARMTIIYALVGLVIAALAQVLVNFVLNKATKI